MAENIEDIGTLSTKNYARHAKQNSCPSFIHFKGTGRIFQCQLNKDAHWNSENHDGTGHFYEERGADQQTVFEVRWWDR